MRQTTANLRLRGGRPTFCHRGHHKAVYLDWEYHAPRRPAYYGTRPRYGCPITTPRQLRSNLKLLHCTVRTVA